MISLVNVLDRSSYEEYLQRIFRFKDNEYLIILMQTISLRQSVFQTISEPLFWNIPIFLQENVKREITLYIGQPNSNLMIKIRPTYCLKQRVKNTCEDNQSLFLLLCQDSNP